MNENRANRLGTGRIPALVFSMGVPAVAAQLFSVLYSTVDRIYIGNIPEIGRASLTGVGVALPVIIIMSAFAFMVGMGGAPLAAMRLGSGDREGAERVLGNALTLLISLSVVLTVLLQLIKHPLLMAFGASEATYQYAGAYLGVYLWATPAIMLTLGLNPYIAAQGRPKAAMAAFLLSSGVNMVLDPIFILALGWGVRGAAFATLISQTVSAVWTIAVLRSDKAVMRIRVRSMKLEGDTTGGILRLGVSPLLMMGTESMVSATLNNSLQRYGGDLYVGSMTILLSLLQLVMTPLNGFTQGTQAILSYNYGARQTGRVKAAFKLIVTTTVFIALALSLTAILFPRAFAGMFSRGDTELIDLTARMMPVFLCGIFAVGAQIACQSAFLALGQAKVSLFVTLLRKVLLLIPLAVILPRFVGVNGVYYAEPIADLTASLITVTLFALMFRRILSNQEKA